MASTIAYGAKMVVEGKDGITYTFPNVDITVAPNIEPGEFWGDPGYFYQQEPSRITHMKIEGFAYPGKTEDYIVMATMEMPMASCKIPELYEDDLIKITAAMGVLDSLSQTGVFSCELRVKTDDVDTWVIIGYGEDGEPAILRFEKDV